MSETTPDTSTPALPEVLPLRLVHVLTSPAETFARLVRVPHWVGPMLVIALVSGACAAVLLSTDVGRQAAFDEAIRSMESFTKVKPEMYEAMRHSMLDAPAWQLALRSAIGPLVVFPIGALAVSGFLFAIFSVLASSETTFKQLFGIVTHSMVVFAVKSIFTTPLSYARESLSSATNLAVFFPMIEEGTLPARLLGSIDLFTIWWLAILSIGLGVLYRRPTRGIFTILATIYVVVCLIIAVVMRAMAGA